MYINRIDEVSETGEQEKKVVYGAVMTPEILSDPGPDTACIVCDELHAVPPMPED